MINHKPGPRRIDKFKPIIILISGKSKSGKSTLSFYLNNLENSKYVSLDAFTVSGDLDIKDLKCELNKLGEKSYLNIHILERYIMEEKEYFINYCYDKISNLDNEIFIIDGIYFNNENFLKLFIEKFKNKYKLWISNPI